MLIDAISAWDLTSEGQPIPCDAESKDKYLPIILGLPLKSDEKYGDILGVTLLGFAADSENFLKN